MKQPLNIVTLCASGDKALRSSRNAARIKLLEASITAIEESPWKDLHAIVLPGGHFFHPRFIGNLSFAERKAAIQKAEYSKSIAALVRRLHEKHPDIVIICGVDSQSPNEWERGDEFCIAWNHQDIIGIGRKVFPVNGDSNGKNGKSIAGYAEDFNSPFRTIMLPSGHRAMLCACYDMFGINEWPDVPSPRKTYMRYLYLEGQLLTKTDRNWERIKRNLISKWRDIVDDKEKPVEVAIAAIHRFAWPNADCFWQRHGIATASAALGGGLAIAAAHFRDFLPYQSESALAAFNVPKIHLKQGCHRQAHSYHAHDALPEVRCGKESAIIRLYNVTQ